MPRSSMRSPPIGFQTKTYCFPQKCRSWSGRPARPRPTALLSPSSDGKPEAATAVVVAPDDGYEDARNMLSCI